MNRLLRSRKATIAAGIGAFVLFVAAGWILLVAPQRSKAAQLDEEITAAQAQLVQRQQAGAKSASSVKVKPSDLYRLTKALPDGTDMAGVILDVNRLAVRNRLAFQSIAPGAELAGVGYVAHPLSVVVQGRFGDVSTFLGDLRTLVGVRKRRLDVRGRLYSVTQVDLAAPEGEKTFPVVKATVSVNAYAFSAPPPTGSTPVFPTSPPSSNGTVAAGATP